MLTRELSLEEKAALAPKNGGRVIPPLRLNLGCGADWMGGGVVNMDCRNLLPPDGMTFLRADVADLRDMFADGAAAEIWAKDVLEHVPQVKAGAVLDEWIRLLAPGGLLHLKTPDLQALARFILEGRASDEVKAYRVYGGQDYAENFHRAGFTVAMLSAMLTVRGMEIVSAKGHEGTNLLITARKR
ncbi:MAG: methyltransferase domain-containing protein [Candidatus Methylomirabilales bacterium]